MKNLKVFTNIKALIFDLDGTLADTMPLHFEAFRTTLEPYGVDFTPNLMVELAGIPAFETIHKLNELFGKHMDVNEVTMQKELEYEQNMYRVKPIFPVVELMKDYYGKLPMAVGTGGSRRLAWETMEILGFNQYIDILVSSEDVTNPKPHPETFLKCAERMNVKPEFCQVFEDGKAGIDAAEKAGMMTTLVTDFYDVSIGYEFN